jgi:putative endonuclease
MYYVYILKSQRCKHLYVGFTGDLRRRLSQHNSGKTKSTKHGTPWKLIYYEAFLSKKDAQKRERTLKHHGSSFGFLKKRIKNSLNKI